MSKDWTGYKIVYESINDPEDYFKITGRSGENYNALDKHRGECVLRGKDIEILIESNQVKIIPPKCIVIKQFFEGL